MCQAPQGPKLRRDHEKRRVHARLYTCTQNEDGLPQINIDYREKTRKFPPEFVSAMILDHVRRKAEETYTIKERPGVVITVLA